MTYISRKTRIIVSRWTDECDADYILRAVRKRSDGRFKRHSSCDDFRAWVNDYCINHEHLVDLMSDGEFIERPPFRLYGRFIPVPILFKLMQNLQNNDAVAGKDKQKSGSSDLVCKSALDKCTGIDSSDFLSRYDKPNVERSASLSRIKWEKNHLEKSLYESTSLLNRALAMLERIDNIADLTKQENENARNEEIQLAFYEAQAVCVCNDFCEGKDSNVSDNLQSSRSYVKKIQDSTKCTELLRKISGLRERLKKVQECRQLITRQIHMAQVKAAKCESSNQVTQLFSFQEQAHLKKLKKKLEKLISERGRLLSEMCDALKDLNVLKRSSRSSLSRQKSSGTSTSEGVFRESASCACGCNCSKASSEFGKLNSDSPSGESYYNESATNAKQMGSCHTFGDSQRNFYSRTPPLSATHNCRSSGIVCQSINNADVTSQHRECKRRVSQYHRSAKEPCATPPQNSRLKQTTSKQRKIIKDTNSSDKSKEIKEGKAQSRVSFADENESPCRKKYYQDDLTAFERSLTSQQQAVIQGALKKIECRRSQLFDTKETQKRPTSSPTTRREMTSLSVERLRNEGCERRVKSETTMQEIEKTLRNYEQRLKNYDALECKVEEIRQRVSEMSRMKKDWARQWEEGQKEVEAEREKSSKEITKLSSENKMLKKEMQRLMAKFESQCKKIQRLKVTAQKNWELECETEELKKELLKYRDTFDHQRKCITKWESVVALQRTEIENLMNHIRRLTTANNYPAECPSTERKNIQRSKSYSPEVINAQGIMSRPKMYGRALKSSSEDECEACYYKECQQLQTMRRNQQDNYDKCCYSAPPGKRMNW